MYSVEIESYLEGSKAPKFSSFDVAKCCYDLAVDFLFSAYPNEYYEVRLLQDELCVLYTCVNP